MQTSNAKNKANELLKKVEDGQIQKDELIELIDTDIDFFLKQQQPEKHIGSYVKTINQRMSNMGFNKEMRSIIQYLIDEYENTESRFLADMYHELVILNFVERDFEEALDVLQKELKIRKQIKDDRGYAMATHTRGVLSQVSNETKKAEKYYLKAWELAKDMKNYRMKDRMIHSIANLYLHHLAEYKKAYEYYKLGLELAQINEDEMKQSFYLDHMGMVRYWQKRYQDALKIHEQSTKILENQEEQTINQFFNIIQKAMNYNKLEEYDKSLEHLMSVSDLKKINTDTYSNVWYNIIIGEILYHDSKLLEPFEMDLEELIGELDHDKILKNTIIMADQGNFPPGSVISRIYRAKYVFEKNPELAISLLSEGKQIATNNNRFREIELLKEMLETINLDYESI